MIDTEVRRLRRLRNTALRARALAAALDSRQAGRNSVPARGAVACWLIARVVTGRLRAHPYPSYQRGPSSVRIAYEQMSAVVVGAIARRRGSGLETLSGELQRVVRELADARALTWSADLSDTFGRSQVQVERLIEEADAGVRTEAGCQRETAAREKAESGARMDTSGNVAANWPYLTFGPGQPHAAASE